MSEQKPDKTALKSSVAKSPSAGKAAASEKKPAPTQTPSDKGARDTERKVPNPAEQKAPVEAGRFASRRVWPD